MNVITCEAPPGREEPGSENNCGDDASPVTVKILESWLVRGISIGSVHTEEKIYQNASKEILMVSDILQLYTFRSTIIRKRIYHDKDHKNIPVLQT